MIADISLPDFETRVAILKTKLSNKKTDLPLEIIEYVALNIKRNIRELEGALNRLAVYQKLNNQTPNLEITKSLLKNIISNPQKTANPEKVIRAVAEFYDLKEEDIIASSRKKEIVKPRQVAMYFLKEDLKSSFSFIGRKFGGKDHTTAMYSYQKILKELESNDSFNEEIGLIRQRILNL